MRSSVFKKFSRTHRQNLHSIHIDVKAAMDIIQLDMDDTTREIMADNLDRCATRLQMTVAWLKNINRRHANQNKMSIPPPNTKPIEIDMLELEEEKGSTPVTENKEETQQIEVKKEQREEIKEGNNHV